MSFNTDLNYNKIFIFSQKMTKSFHSQIYFKHLNIGRNLSEWKIEFILSYLVRNFQINARNKLREKCLFKFSHYIRPHFEYGGIAPVNK